MKRSKISRLIGTKETRTGMFQARKMPAEDPPANVNSSAIFVAEKNVSSRGIHFACRSAVNTLSCNVKTVHAVVAATKATSQRESRPRKATLGAHHLVLIATATLATTDSDIVIA